MTVTAVETYVPPGIESGDQPVPVTPSPWGLPPLDPERFRSLFPVTPDTTKTSAKRRLVVNRAMRYLGVKYQWGGNGPNGLDCSGLIQFVGSQFGIDLPRVSFQQANAGRRVPLAALKPGDLVAWDNSARNNGADHIAWYAGDGWVVEAPRPGLRVRRRRLNGDEGAYGVSLAALYGEA